MEYADRQMCLDGIERRKVFYICRRKDVKPGSPAHEEGHCAAEAAAWAHAKQV